MPFQTLQVETKDGIWLARINRPEALNALNAQVLKDLSQALDQIEKEATARALILTGSGEKAFVAGADITEIDQLDPKGAMEFAIAGQRLFRRLEKLRIPVIAAVNGFALGGGLELALACDFIIASQNAKFGLPECTLGIMPGFGGTVRLPRRVGPARAKEMTFSGSFVSAPEAATMGLANRIVEPSELIKTCEDIAKTMASRAPQALALIKRSVQEGLDVDIDHAMQIEAQYFSDLFHTQDQREGTRAFVEKRKPVFSGK